MTASKHQKERTSHNEPVRSTQQSPILIVLRSDSEFLPEDFQSHFYNLKNLESPISQKLKIISPLLEQFLS
ncbi:hypothetical protein MtrunA17_Chr4g0013101 [Medicago truncatula]|uniref:Uncharacterized protein n=1 Tax=Medicago truncatula TaxID=3880 RepID=A0A396I1D3_MEDTR|nr:hypothetical protein MtrunA17_Chr4g0013101 [Medicago truncatula]